MWLGASLAAETAGDDEPSRQAPVEVLARCGTEGLVACRERLGRLLRYYIVPLRDPKHQHGCRAHWSDGTIGARFRVVDGTPLHSPGRGFA